METNRTNDFIESYDPDHLIHENRLLRKILNELKDANEKLILELEKTKKLFKDLNSRTPPYGL